MLSCERNLQSDPGCKEESVFFCRNREQSEVRWEKNNAAVAYKRGEEKQSSWLRDSIIFTTQQKN